MKRMIVLAVALACAACGSKAPLEHPAEAEPVPIPYGQSYPPSTDELLEPSEQAVLERNIELRERSEERADDPFDLPPE